MKKISLFLFVSLFTLCASAQYLPRWGSGPPTNDNTGRVLTYGIQSTATVTGTTDTISVVPGFFWTGVNPSDSIKGTTIYVIKAGQNFDYNGDWLEFYGYASAINTPKIEFRNANGISFYTSPFKFIDTVGFHVSAGSYKLGADSTITLPKGKYYDVLFHYDGVHFLEQYKVTGH